MAEQKGWKSFIIVYLLTIFNNSHFIQLSVALLHIQTVQKKHIKNMKKYYNSKLVFLLFPRDENIVKSRFKKKPLYWKIKKVTYLKSSDDEQGVDVMDPNLLSDLVQMFAWKSSSIKKGNISTIKQSSTSFLFSWCFYWAKMR